MGLRATKLNKSLYSKVSIENLLCRVACIHICYNSLGLSVGVKVGDNVGDKAAKGIESSNMYELTVCKKSNLPLDYYLCQSLTW